MIKGLQCPRTIAKDWNEAQKMSIKIYRWTYVFYPFFHLLSNTVQGTGMGGEQQLQRSTRLETQKKLGTQRTGRWRAGRRSITLARRLQNAFKTGRVLPSEGQWTGHSSKARHESQPEVLGMPGGHRAYRSDERRAHVGMKNERGWKVAGRHHSGPWKPGYGGWTSG